MKTTAKIVLFVVGTICYATMWEIQFHWERLFAHWFPTGHDHWWNPATSWENKYVVSAFWTFILSTVVVWATDFFHFLQTIFLGCMFMIIIFQAEPNRKWWQYLIMLLGFFLVWGLVFELMAGVFGALASHYTI